MNIEVIERVLNLWTNGDLVPDPEADERVVDDVCDAMDELEILYQAETA